MAVRVADGRVILVQTGLVIPLGNRHVDPPDPQPVVERRPSSRLKNTSLNNGDPRSSGEISRSCSGRHGYLTYNVIRYTLYT